MDDEFVTFEVNEGEKPYNIGHRCFFLKASLYLLEIVGMTEFIVLYLISY